MTKLKRRITKIIQYSMHVINRIWFSLFYSLCVAKYICFGENKFIKKETLLHGVNIKDHGFIVLKKHVSDEIMTKIRDRLILNLKDARNKPWFIGEKEGHKNNWDTYDYPIEYLSQVNYLFDPIKSFPGLVSLIDKYFGSLIRGYFGCNYYLAKIWLYETKNDGKETFNLNSKLHTDGDHAGSIKILVYLCDVDKSNGPLSIRDKNSGNVIRVIGASGTAILFHSPSAYHAGDNTISRNRYTLSMLAMPALSSKASYTHIPDNVLCKKNPFMR